MLTSCAGEHNKIMRVISLALIIGAASAYYLPVAARPAAASRSSTAVMELSPELEHLTYLLSMAQSDAKLAKSPIEMVNAQELVDALYDRIERQQILEKVDEDASIIAKVKALAGGEFPVDTQSWKQFDLHEM